MKSIGKAFLAVLLLGACFFTGCTENGSVNSADEKQKKAEEKIAILENELQSLREECYIKETEYRDKIAKLESKLTEETAPASQESGSLVFSYQTENGEVTITGVQGELTFLTVPETLNGLPVRKIAERAFESRDCVAVILPEGLTSIGWFAFYNCGSLRDISVPASVSEIGYAAFEGCPDVTLVCEANSFAEKYAESFGLNTVCQGGK